MSQDEFLIFHISDLHFAKEFYPTWNRLTAPVVSIAPIFTVQGLFPHDLGACEELENEIKNIIRDQKPRRALLVVSGDLTVKGDDSEFVMALTYLKGRIRRDWSDFIGLGPYISEVFAVPGNHDHWLGSNLSSIISGLSPIHDIYFPCLPNEVSWHQVLEEPPIQLQLIGLDSRDPHATAIAARGSLDVNLLNALSTEIKKADSVASNRNLTTVRVLIIHHSPAYRSPRISVWLHELDPNSRLELDKFCQNNKIHFVLSGHVHAPLVPPNGTPHKFGMELRCGTTLQGAPVGNYPTKRGNILLLHSISYDRGSVYWTTDVYQRAQYGPFTKAPSRTLGPLVL